MDPASPPVATFADTAVDGEVVRSRAPSTGVSIRCSETVYPGRSFPQFPGAVAAASTIAEAPSVIGAMSFGATDRRRAAVQEFVDALAGFGVDPFGSDRTSSATWAICSGGPLAGIQTEPGLQRGPSTPSRPQRRDGVGSVCMASTRRSVPAEDRSRTPERVSTSPVSNLM